VRFLPTRLPAVIVVEPDVHRDERGFFLESYHADKYREGGVDAVFVQDNHSRSARRTLRGLHAQWRRPQGKLLRVLSGAIWDVAVDVRKGSPSFGQWVGEHLDAETHRQIWVPAGFLHGFCVLSETAEVEYKCTAPYDPGGELGVRWDDPGIGIEWPVQDPVLSGKDAAAPLLDEVRDKLPEYRA
jgi:dTDP-4-dehydrorhamnose 3,5-epimerase